MNTILKLIIIKFILLFSLNVFAIDNNKFFDVMKEYVSQNGDHLFLLNNDEEIKEQFDIDINKTFQSAMYLFKNETLFFIFINNDYFKKECIYYYYVYDISKCLSNTEEFTNFFSKSFEETFFLMDKEFLDKFYSFILSHEFSHYILAKKSSFDLEYKNEMFCDLMSLSLMKKYLGINFKSELIEHRKIAYHHRGDFGSYYNQISDFRIPVDLSEISIEELEKSIRKYIVSIEAPNNESYEIKLHKNLIKRYFKLKDRTNIPENFKEYIKYHEEKEYKLGIKRS